MLREDLGRLRGAPITDAELNASIARLQRQPRARSRELYAYRAAKPWQAPTVRGLPGAARRHGAAARGAHALVREYLAAADALPRPKRDNARVVLTGAFCEQPPLGLIKSIEMAGCYIVDDDFMLVTRWLLDDVPADGNPLEELSKAFLHRSASTAAKYDTTREEKGVFLLKQVKTRGAEGVIFAAPSFCDPALLERPMLQDVLEQAQGPAHRVQVRREHRPDGADPRAGRHFRRFDQTVERRMSAPTASQCPPASQEAAERPEGGRDVAAEGADQRQLPRPRHRAPARAQGVGDLRARQPERAADVLRLRAQPARDQRAAERHAQEVRQDDHGRRARRPVRGRLHLRQGRPRHDDGRRDRPDRRGAAPARRPAAVLHRLLHVHEVVRADPPQVRLRDGDAARALPGRGQDRAEHARLRRQAAEGDGDPDARAHLGRQVRHRPAAPVHARIGEGRGRSGRGAAVGEEPAVADRRLLRRRLLHRPDLHRLPRHARGDRVLPRAARRDRGARARGQGPDHARGRDGRGEVPAGRRRPAQLDQLPRVLEDVLRRGRGRRLVDLRQGRRRSTTSASATTPTIRSSRWPSTASAATPTSTCRRAST